MKQKQILIQNIQDLTEKLGDSFILMLGSAVPGVNSPQLPMVPEVMENIFKNMHACLENRTYDEKIVAEYAKSLCVNGVDGRDKLSHLDRDLGLMLWKEI